MKPFLITEGGKKLVAAYPDSNLIKENLRALSLEERIGFLRLWISEGIPFAFRETPLLYEAARKWLGDRLLIHPKLITVIGSGRVGYSLKAVPEFGRAFGKHSDLDLSIIEEITFARLQDEFLLWKQDVGASVVTARNPREESYWSQNLQRLPANLSRGFVDPYMIPSFYRYPTVQKINDAHASLASKIKMTPGAPRFKRISSRVYRDWKSFMGQMELNLGHTLRSIIRLPGSI